VHAVQVRLRVAGDGRGKGAIEARRRTAAILEANDQAEAVEAVCIAIANARDRHGGDPVRVDAPGQQIDQQPPADDEARAALPAVDDQRVLLDGVEDRVRAGAAERVPDECAQPWRGRSARGY
jgi:hypothetical protein